MQIILIFFLIMLTGVFALAEMAFVSARKPRLQQWASEGNINAQIALALANNPETFLATIQIGMTLVTILTGALAERTLSEGIETYLTGIPRLAPYGHKISLVTVVLGVTFFTLVIGELVPKRIALHNPERLASMLARPMEAFSRVAKPLVGILNRSTSVILNLLRIRPSEEPQVTEEEIKVIMEQGAEAGVIEETEHEMVSQLFRLSDRAVMALMTPRPEIVWLDADAPMEENMKTVAGSSHTRFPVAHGSLDNVIGIAKEKDLMTWGVAGQTINLKDIVRPPLFVPGAISAFRLLEMFKKSRTHLALVVDEYGDVQGLVTINDFFEDLVGDVASADKPQERYAEQRPDGSWVIDGKMLVHDFKQLLNTGKLPGEERGRYLTVGGFVMMQVGHIPSASDGFEAAGLRFEVIDMDEKRVGRVLVKPIPSTAQETGDIQNGTS